MSCDCMVGIAYFWRDGIEGSDRMCSGTLTWLLKNDVVRAESPAFISAGGTRLEWSKTKLVLMK